MDSGHHLTTDDCVNIYDNAGDYAGALAGGGAFLFSKNPMVAATAGVTVDKAIDWLGDQVCTPADASPSHPAQTFESSFSAGSGSSLFGGSGSFVGSESGGAFAGGSATSFESGGGGGGGGGGGPSGD